MSDFVELTPGAKPEKKLLRPKRRTGGRNNQGKITARHRGGGHKRKYRRIDFRRRLMACDGGPEWLLHCARLYNFRERLLGPDHIGLPKSLRIQMGKTDA